MVQSQRKYLLPAGLVIIIVAFILSCRNFNKTGKEDDDLAGTYERQAPYLEYSPDSAYLVEADTVLHVWNVRTWKEINRFKFDTAGIRQMAVHPSGKVLAILYDYSLVAWDLQKGEPGPENDVTDLFGYDLIAFSKDGRYLIAIDCADVTVEVYRWPGLKYLATGFLGIRRNSFRWENPRGKLVFYFEMDNHIFKTEFPADSSADPLTFTKEVMVDTMKVK
jgi:WD40 repeat protein